jgi:hypothetical protein
MKETDLFDSASSYEARLSDYQHVMRAGHAYPRVSEGIMVEYSMIGV